MKSGGTLIVLLNLLIFSIFSGFSIAGEVEKIEFKAKQEKLVLEWRKERNEFFKSHQRSPLTPRIGIPKRAFVGRGEASNEADG